MDQRTSDLRARLHPAKLPTCEEEFLSSKIWCRCDIKRRPCSSVRLCWALAYWGLTEWTMQSWKSMQKARGIYCSSALGSSQTRRRGGAPQHLFSEFLYGFQGQNRASATRHNMIGGTVHPLNWLVFREWGDKDFPCLKVGNSPSCRMCPHPQVGSHPVV